MFVVEINRANFEYDVHSIVKAFWPEEDVKVLTPETGEQKREELIKELKLKLELTETQAELLVLSNTEDTFVWQWSESEGGSYKDGFKRFLYRSLQTLTGMSLPWGNLTGIRPTKIAYGMLEEGKTEEAVLQFLKEKHYVSKEKSQLSIDIAKRERELLSQVHYEGGYSLYIGIPFCPTTCLYCSFTSFAIGAYRKQAGEYVDCLIREMEYVAECYRDKILDSVYIGGGTPTTLEADQLDRLIGRLKELFDFSQVKEFTVEAGRADSITREKLEVLYRHGVGRISINPQTMKQETLNIIGRRHTVEQVDREKVFPHNLRHLFACTFYSIEKDITRLADILGHSNINTTRIYTLVSLQEQEKKIEQLGLVV